MPRKQQQIRQRIREPEGEVSRAVIQRSGRAKYEAPDRDPAADGHRRGVERELPPFDPASARARERQQRAQHQSVVREVGNVRPRMGGISAVPRRLHKPDQIADAGRAKARREKQQRPAERRIGGLALPSSVEEQYADRCQRQKDGVDQRSPKWRRRWVAIADPRDVGRAVQRDRYRPQWQWIASAAGRQCRAVPQLRRGWIGHQSDPQRDHQAPGPGSAPTHGRRPDTRHGYRSPPSPWGPRPDPEGRRTATQPSPINGHADCHSPNGGSGRRFTLD